VETYKLTVFSKGYVFTDALTLPCRPLFHHSGPPEPTLALTHQEVRMRPTIAFGLTILFFLFGSTVAANTIYTWTDADGVKRYSNSQPPEDAENVRTIEEIQYDQGDANQRRHEYDRMVEDASKSADRHFEEQALEKTRQAEAMQQSEQDIKDQQIEKARAELLKEIDAIQKRGYSPTFTQGMKENLIKEVQEKIDQLEGNTGN
jgi:Domain of unknown function (DUF4124)